MSSFDYAASQSAADRLIRKFGQAATLTHNATVPASNPWESPTTTTTTHAVQIVVETYKDGLVNGTSILAGDRKILLSALGLTVAPTVKDTLTIGADVWSVVNVKPLSPGATVVLYEIQARM
jgi:hypothetical protein